MGALEKITFGIMGVGIAAGAAYLILELSKTHLNTSKTIVDVASKVGDLAADNISNRPDDKPIIEGLKIANFRRSSLWKIANLSTSLK